MVEYIAGAILLILMVKNSCLLGHDFVSRGNYLICRKCMLTITKNRAKTTIK